MGKRGLFSPLSLSLHPRLLGFAVGLIALPITLISTGPGPHVTNSNFLDRVSVTGSFQSLLRSPSRFLTLPAATHAAHLLVIASLAALVLLSVRAVCRPYEDTRVLPPAEREAALHRQPGDVPPPFPSTWFRLCCSSDLSSSAPLTVSAFSRRLTLTRTPDAVVCTDELHRPYETLEADRSIVVWFDPADRPSSWRPPLIGQNLSQFRFVGRVNAEVSAHLQELPENGADAAHLDHLHGPFVLPFLPRVRHTWHLTWTPQPPPDGHLARLTIDSTVAVLSHPIACTSLSTSVTQVGPALVHILIRTRFGLVVMVETVTPIAPSLQRCTHVWWAAPGVPWLVAKLVAVSAQRQFDRDTPVWNRKRLLRAPKLVGQDGGILRFRRWMRQFYQGQRAHGVGVENGTKAVR